MTDFATLILAADTRQLEHAVASLDGLVVSAGKAEVGAKKFSGGAKQAGDSAATAAPKIGAAAAAADLMQVASSKAARALGVMAAGFVSMAAISGSVTQAREFNAAIAETSTLIKGTPEEIAALEAGARKLALTFGGEATPQVKAYYQALSAGAASVGEATALLGTANKLAVGGVTDVTTAVDILTTATNIYKTEGLLAADASDALFVAMRAGKTTVGELASGMGQVLPLAQKLGVSFDETAAATSALTKGGLATTSAITGLRAAMTAVLGPSAEATKLAQKLGIDFTASGLKAKGFSDFMADVVAKTGGSAEAMATLFGSVEATTVALSLSGAAGGYMNDILGQMKTKAGETQTAFDKINESLDGRLSRALAATSDIALGLGKIALPLVVFGLEAVAGVTKIVSEHMDVLAVGLGAAATAYVATLIPAAWAAVAAFSGNIIALGSLIAEFGVATVATKLFGAAFILSNPVGWAIGIGMAAAGLYALATSAGQAATAADIQATAARSLNAALTGVNLASAEGAVKARELAQATLDAARADLLAAQLRLQQAEATSKAMAGTRGGIPAAIAAREAAKAIEEQRNIMIGLVAEAERLGIVLSRVPSEIRNASAEAHRLGVEAGISADAALGIAVAVGNINMSSAISGANALAARLGVALDVAIALSATLDRAAGIQRAAKASTGPSLSFGAKVPSLGVDVPSVTTGTKAVLKFASAAEIAAMSSRRASAQAAELTANLGGAGGGVAGAAKEATVALTAAQEAAKKYAETMSGFVTDGIGKAVDWMVNGFKGGLKGLLDIFKQTIAQMISYALKNKIMIAIGGSGGIAGSAASAVTGAASGGGSGGLIGGVLSNFLGSWGTAGVAGTGLLGGLGASLTGGLANVFSIGSNIAAAGGGIAAGLGAILAPIAIIAGIFSFFKKKVTVLDQGLSVAIAGVDVAVKNFTTTKTTRFWGLSKKIKTTEADADPELTSQVNAIYDSIHLAVGNAATSLGVGASVLDGFTHSLKVSLKGLTDEQAQKAVADAFLGMSDAMAKLVLAGSGVVLAGRGATEVLQGLANALTGSNAALKLFGWQLFQTSIAGGLAAEEFVKKFGGLEQFLSTTGFYFENFYSEQERAQKLAANFQAALAGLGVSAMPASLAQFRTLIESFEALGNRDAVAKLMQLAPALVSILDLQTASMNERIGLEEKLLQLQGRTAELRERELAKLDPANRAMQIMIWRLEDMQSTLKPENFKTLFDFNKAVAVGSGVGGQGATLSSVSYSAPQTASAAPPIAAPQSTSEAMLFEVATTVKRLLALHRDWDTIGLPAERTA
jgi:TP901 family phage tail tape measure protein